MAATSTQVRVCMGTKPSSYSHSKLPGTSGQMRSHHRTILYLMPGELRKPKHCRTPLLVSSPNCMTPFIACPFPGTLWQIQSWSASPALASPCSACRRRGSSCSPACGPAFALVHLLHFQAYHCLIPWPALTQAWDPYALCENS